MARIAGVDLGPFGGRERGPRSGTSGSPSAKS